MIYAIRALGTEYVKIGRANGPAGRLTTHQIGCPFELKLLAIADWPNKDEKHIHRLLVASHHRGEWFALTPEVEAMIVCMNSGRHWSSYDPVVFERRLGRVIALAKK